MVHSCSSRSSPSTDENQSTPFASNLTMRSTSVRAVSARALAVAVGAAFSCFTSGFLSLARFGAGWVQPSPRPRPRRGRLHSSCPLRPSLRGSWWAPRQRRRWQQPRASLPAVFSSWMEMTLAQKSASMSCLTTSPWRACSVRPSGTFRRAQVFGTGHLRPGTASKPLGRLVSEQVLQLGLHRLEGNLAIAAELWFALARVGKVLVSQRPLPDCEALIAESPHRAGSTSCRSCSFRPPW